MEVSEILQQIDIIDYISQYVELEERGGEFWGLSPFNNEKTPSFSVNREKQNFFDFSAGFGGNLITFVQKYHNYSLPKAVSAVKAYAGISDDVHIGTSRLETTKIAKRFLRKDPTPPDAPCAVLPESYLDTFETDPSLLEPWESEGISIETMQSFGVGYDRLSNRIVYPIRNYAGELINVSGRTLDPDYKAKKLRKYTYLKPFNTCLDTLYGFSHNKESILEKREVIVFEGAKSVMHAYTWGIKNTCAVLTSHLNPQQALFLIKLGVRVVFAFDKEIYPPDDKNIQKLKRYVTTEYIYDSDGLLDEKMAPVDKGKEVFNRLYNERRKML